MFWFGLWMFVKKLRPKKNKWYRPITLKKPVKSGKAEMIFNDTQCVLSDRELNETSGTATV